MENDDIRRNEREDRNTNGEENEVQRRKEVGQGEGIGSKNNRSN